MDIYKYINSKSISDHLRELNWQFTPFEEAQLIWRWNGPITERLNAWQQLIDETSDQEITLRIFDTETSSLHAFLSKVIKSYKREIDNFFYKRGESICYKLTIQYSDGEDVDHDMLFYGSPIGRNGTNYHSALSDTIKDKDIRFFEITKLTMEHKPPYDKVVFNSNLELIEIESHDKELSTIECTFLEHWFYFPLPFRKGDIIYHNDRYYENRNPMVYIDTKYTPFKSSEKHNDSSNEDYRDPSYMFFNAYTVSEHCDVNKCSLWANTKFEPYSDEERDKFINKSTENLKTYILTIMISKFLKGELNLASLLAGYDKVKYINSDDHYLEQLFANVGKLIKPKDKQDE